MPVKSFFRQLRRISALHLGLDLVIMFASVWLSLYLRVGPVEFIEHTEALFLFLPVILTVRVISLSLFGCYQVMWRYVSTVDAAQLAKAVLVSVMATVAITFFLPDTLSRLPRSV